MEAKTLEGPARGWYPDPEDWGSERYWDGAGWTDNRVPATKGVRLLGIGVETIDGVGHAPRTRKGMIRNQTLIFTILGVLAMASLPLTNVLL